MGIWNFVALTTDNPREPQATYAVCSALLEVEPTSTTSFASPGSGSAEMMPVGGGKQFARSNPCCTFAKSLIPSPHVLNLRGSVPRISSASSDSPSPSVSGDDGSTKIARGIVNDEPLGPVRNAVTATRALTGSTYFKLKNEFAARNN